RLSGTFAGPAAIALGTSRNALLPSTRATFRYRPPSPGATVYSSRSIDGDHTGEPFVAGPLGRVVGALPSTFVIAGCRSVIVASRLPSAETRPTPGRRSISPPPRFEHSGPP